MVRCWDDVVLMLYLVIQPMTRQTGWEMLRLPIYDLDDHQFDDTSAQGEGLDIGVEVEVDEDEDRDSYASKSSAQCTFI